MGLFALLIVASADGCPTLAQPLPLPHLHRRDESEFNVIGYSGLAIAVIGVTAPALGVLKGWEFWMNRRGSQKGVCIFPSCFLWWRW